MAMTRITSEPVSIDLKTKVITLQYLSN